MALLLRLYPFKFREPVTRCWTKARYKASLADIAARYAEWMIAGEPEVRDTAMAASFHPYPKAPPLERSDVEVKVHVGDELERLLVAAFLRRYVTYCHCVRY